MALAITALENQTVRKTVGKKPVNVALAFEMGMDAFEFTTSLRLNILGEKISLRHHQRQCVSEYEGTMGAGTQNECLLQQRFK